MNNHERLEAVAQELIDVFGIVRPPVPVETMLTDPPDGMWERVDVTQLSGTFLSFTDRYSPRMSLARLLARHAAYSNWGKARQLDQMVKDEDSLRAFARMIIVPAEMVQGLTKSGRNPTTMSLEFEVPEDDARIRLQELLLG